ncbi:MAG: VCBS repeat-containing protein [Verrucomicrobia bacterium]|nr:MAG: VCBS repeat-containing protein [Verrucomicrobiota bacterium]
MRQRPPLRTLCLFLILAGAVAVLPACRKAARKPVAPRAATVAPAPVVATDTVTHEPIGRDAPPPPWIANVNAIDVDQDGLLDIVACEARTHEVVWIRQVARGVFEERTIATDIKAPVHAEAADIDDDGDLDLLIASMGFVFPNKDLIGSVVILENDGQNAFTSRFVATDTYRVTDVRAADFNGDGRKDLAVAQFGYDQGQVMWMERVGPWEFRQHPLLGLSGAINVCIDDFNGDTHPDIVALISQQWEEVYYFQNKGDGTFETRRIWGSTNEDYGSSGLSLGDLNQDGRMDILYTNGDGFGPAVMPGPRPWHGVQWFESMGNGYFKYHRVGNLPGAYSPVAVDFDRDGAVDIIASSAYADWERKGTGVVTLMWFRNDGRLNFQPHILAYGPRDLITVTAGDFDGNGQPALVTGSFPVAPPYDDTSRLLIWRRNPAP